MKLLWSKLIYFSITLYVFSSYFFLNIFWLTDSTTKLMNNFQQNVWIFHHPKSFEMKVIYFCYFFCFKVTTIKRSYSSELWFNKFLTNDLYARVTRHFTAEVEKRNQLFFSRRTFVKQIQINKFAYGREKTVGFSISTTKPLSHVRRSKISKCDLIRGKFPAQNYWKALHKNRSAKIRIFQEMETISRN